jgi:N4-gp56 family major capsid protein
VGTAPAAGNSVVAIGPGAGNAPVASTLVFGQNAYGVVAMDNANVRSIVKPVGSAGTADPLEQAATVGWKVNDFTAKLLEPGWLVQILHGITE